MQIGCSRKIKKIDQGLSWTGISPNKSSRTSRHRPPGHQAVNRQWVYCYRNLEEFLRDRKLPPSFLAFMISGRSMARTGQSTKWWFRAGILWWCRANALSSKVIAHTQSIDMLTAIHTRRTTSKPLMVLKSQSVHADLPLWHGKICYAWNINYSEPRLLCFGAGRHRWWRMGYQWAALWQNHFFSVKDGILLWKQSRMKNWSP